MKKYLLSLLLALMLVIIPAVPAIAADTADVTVTYTPEYISIADNVTTVDFGNVALSANISIGTNFIGITNTSSVQTDVTIAVTGATWTGGTVHTHANNAQPGADIVGLLSNRGGTWGTGDVIVKFTASNYIYENCPATTSFTYGLRLVTPTGSTDGTQKTNTVRITAASG